jgi:hypothetical protein
MAVNKLCVLIQLNYSNYAFCFFPLSFGPAQAAVQTDYLYIANLLCMANKMACMILFYPILEMCLTLASAGIIWQM